MTSKLPELAERLKTPPMHYSYLKHRRQMMRQVVLPVVLSGLALVGMIVWISIATFKQGGDVGRWAAISTIWVIIPMLVAGLVVLAILGGLIYGMARLLKAIPYYTGIAQEYVILARGYIIRGADMAVKPILKLNEWLQTAKAFFERITP
jgi:FtsH-binding integral membrane protein